MVAGARFFLLQRISNRFRPIRVIEFDLKTIGYGISMKYIFSLIFLLSLNSHASTSHGCEAVAEVREVINCRNPKKRCKLDLKFKCEVAKTDCSWHSLGKLEVTGLVKTPRIGDTFVVDYESACSSPFVDGTDSPCQVTTKVKEHRNCTEDEIKAYEEFKFSFNCRWISQQFSTASEIKTDQGLRKLLIEEETSPQCVLKNANPIRNSQEAQLYIGTLFYSANSEAQKVAYEKLKSFNCKSSKSVGTFDCDSFRRDLKYHYELSHDSRVQANELQRKWINEIYKNATGEL